MTGKAERANMLERMREDLKASYGLACCHASPIDGGWLNRMWKAATDEGMVLVKQFSAERFGREKLRKVEAALQRQVLLYASGVRCPRVFLCRGQAIRLLDEETAYMVMAYCPGKTADPASITPGQMRSLGEACGCMHKAFAQLPVQSVQGYPLDAIGMLDALWDNYHARLEECASSPFAEYTEAVHAQEPILKQLDATFFHRLPKGIAHEDFTSDNILFTEAGVSAIIDFDRNQYSYPLHDVGRALLSFALDDQGLDMGLVSAFAQGYCWHLPLTKRDVADALRLAWCIEAPWWIQPQFFEKNRGKATRFRDEILWLTRHWFRIEEMLDAWKTPPAI